MEAEAGGEVEEAVGVVGKTWWHYVCATERQSELRGFDMICRVYEGLQ